jgi:hypothetical protein
VDSVVRLTLINADNPLFEHDVSHALLKIGIFEKTEETEFSKVEIKLIPLSLKNQV